MTIITDTREQTAWHFTCHNLVRTLAIGDYATQGFENEVCVERKSLNDLVHSVIHDYIRFSKALRRMAGMNVAAIVCESSFDALANKCYESEALPSSVAGKLAAILIDFGIPTLFLDTRELCAVWVEQLFQLYVNRQVDKCVTPIQP